MWTELASQRRQLTDGLAEKGKVLMRVLAEQRQLIASTTAMLPPFGQQAVPRRYMEDIVRFGCHQKGHIRRNWKVQTNAMEGGGKTSAEHVILGRPTDVFTSHCGTRVSSSVHSTRHTLQNETAH